MTKLRPTGTKIQMIIEAEVDYDVNDDDYDYFNGSIHRMRMEHRSWTVHRIRYKIQHADGRPIRRRQFS